MDTCEPAATILWAKPVENTRSDTGISVSARVLSTATEDPDATPSNQASKTKLTNEFVIVRS